MDAITHTYKMALKDSLRSIFNMIDEDFTFDVHFDVEYFERMPCLNSVATKSYLIYSLASYPILTAGDNTYA